MLDGKHKLYAWPKGIWPVARASTPVISLLLPTTYGCPLNAGELAAGRCYAIILM